MLAVFDLDGTLIDSRRDLAESANEMLAGYGAPSIAEEDIVRMVGCGAATLVTRVLAAAHVDVPLDRALDRFLAVYDQRLTGHTRPYEGVPALLEDLRRSQIPMAMLTNKPFNQTVKILQEFGLAGFFPWTVGGDGPHARKPSPDGLHFLMAQTSTDRGETVLIGDSIVDLQTSRNAGVRICLARYGFGFADLPAGDLRGDEWIVDTPGDIAGVLKGWGQTP